jgi:hypothetical protein
MNNPACELKKQHRFTDFLYWNLVIAVPFFTACAAILKYSTAWLIIYIIAGLVCVITIYKFYCTHCPHYTRNTGTTKCMFFWGIPKFFKPDSGPLSLLDKAVTFLTVTVIVLLPVYWLILQPGFMIIYILSIAVFLMTVRRNECGRCIYFNCPVNAVPDDIKKKSIPETER